VWSVAVEALVVLQDGSVVDRRSLRRRHHVVVALVAELSLITRQQLAIGSTVRIVAVETAVLDGFVYGFDRLDPIPKLLVTSEAQLRRLGRGELVSVLVRFVACLALPLAVEVGPV